MAISKHRQTKNANAKKAREEFWKNLPESELNPNAKQDFDSVLGEMLKPTIKKKNSYITRRGRKPKK